MRCGRPTRRSKSGRSAERRRAQRPAQRQPQPVGGEVAPVGLPVAGQALEQLDQRAVEQQPRQHTPAMPWPAGEPQQAEHREGEKVVGLVPAGVERQRLVERPERQRGDGDEGKREGGAQALARPERRVAHPLRPARRPAARGSCAAPVSQNADRRTRPSFRSRDS